MKKKVILFFVLGSLFLLFNFGFFFSFTQAGVGHQEQQIPSPHQEDQQNPHYIVPVFHADAGRPYTEIAGSLVYFDGSLSYIGVGGDALYQWNFGDDIIGYGKKITHRYMTPGIYYATLTVIKGDEQSMDITPVYISQTGDTIQPYAGCLYQDRLGEPIQFDASQSRSTDPEAPLVEWTWFFGDGTTEQGIQVSHGYTKENIYLASLSVTDSKGRTRCDVFHVDIGCTLTSYEDFFHTNDPLFSPLFDLLFQRLELDLLFSLLDVNLYINYNGQETMIPITRHADFPIGIDVNNNEINDLQVNQIVFFKPVLSDSVFQEFIWFSFETTVVDVQKISDDIATSDNLTVCLQFSLQLVADLLGLDEPVIRIGYHSTAGQEKPGSVTATHIFKPYLLLRLLNYEENNNEQIQPQFYQQLLAGQQQASPLSTPEEIYPEYSARVDHVDTPSLSFLFMIANSEDTESITFILSYDPFIASSLTHRKAYHEEQWIRDVAFQGSSESTLTLSITKKEGSKQSTLSMIITPIRSFLFHMDFTPLDHGGGHLSFTFDNPPDNIMFFAQSQDLQSENSLYFTLRHLSTTLDFTWIPQLQNGYISFKKDAASTDFELGICDNIQNPTINLTITHLPVTSLLSWNISKTQPRMITFNSDTTGLTLCLDLNESIQEHQYVHFMATSQENLNVSLQWDRTNGTFRLMRSASNITFTLALIQESLFFTLDGICQRGSGDGVTFYLNSLLQGCFQIGGNVALEITFHLIQQPTINLDAHLQFITGGIFRVSWDDPLQIDITGTNDLRCSNFQVTSDSLVLTLDELRFISNGTFHFLFDMARYIQMNGNATISLTNLHGQTGKGSASLSSLDIQGGSTIFLNLPEHTIQCSSDTFLSLLGLSAEYTEEPEESSISFILDSLHMTQGGIINLNLSSTPKTFFIQGISTVDLMGLRVILISNGTPFINFTLGSAHLILAGQLQTEWTDSSLFLGGTAAFEFSAFHLTCLQYALTADEIETAGGYISFYNEGGHNLKMLGTGFVSLTNLHVNMGCWVTTISSLSFAGVWETIVEPADQYLRLANEIFFRTEGLFLTYDDRESEERMDIELGSLTMDSGGTCWCDFKTASPRFQIQGYGALTLYQFHLFISENQNPIVNFTIPTATIQRAGYLYGEWNSTCVLLNATINLSWDVKIETMHYNNWMMQGVLNGSARIRVEQQSPTTGLLTFEVGDPGLFHSLSITNNDLQIDLGSFNFTSGIITMKWEQEANRGDDDAPYEQYYINISNTNVVGDISFLSITSFSSSNQLQFGQINLSSGYTNLSQDDYLTNTKYYTLVNTAIINVTLFKIIHDEITLELSGLHLKPGRLKFTYDYLNREITIKNNISDFGPSFSYDNGVRKNTISFLNLGHDYSKTITLRWYEAGGSISGLRLDTDDYPLAQWIQFETIKDTTGRRITLEGLQADDFTIRFVDGKLTWSGTLNLANNLIFSKLVNGQWKNLNFQWDIDGDGKGSITLSTDYGFDENLEIDITILGVTIQASLEIQTPCCYFSMGWDIDFDLEGYIFLNTDDILIDSLSFSIVKDKAPFYPKWGIEFSAVNFQVLNFNISWDFNDPNGSWEFHLSGGYLELIDILNIAWNGQWFDVIRHGTPL